ncbi:MULTISPECIES: S8 family serine peptidase [Nocardiopsis]|uniref:Peptidase S8 n=1 Tax=Nocardiopsis sinuspersici TaxID=501010 RepID=A0A1V3C509_9ACTN|nr:MULTISPECIES: S8 family serine peptidase [Nocardiopsis]OOC55712.1 peptidase S8 [Nocardiopsis sinuspersici]
MLGGNSRSRTHTRRTRGGTASACAAAVTATAVLLGPAAPASADLVPDYRPEQWGLQTIAAQELWEDTQGQGVTVALPGTSVNEEHPDLVDNVRVDTRFGTGGDAGAGSAMASLAAAHGHGFDADGGMLGVAPESTVLVLPTGDRLAEAVRFAAQEDVQVILLPETDGAADLAGATQAAVDNGVLVVGPAGGPEDPNVLTVAGTDADGALVPNSPDTGSVALTAPGADLMAADTEVGYTEVTGAQYAAAMAAGAAALLRSDHPHLLPGQVRDALVEGSRSGPEGLPALHLPSAQEQATAIAQDNPAFEEDVLSGDGQGWAVPVWVWFATVGAVVVLGVLLVVLWIRRSTADPYGVEAERQEEDERIAAERAAEAPPASRRKRGGRRRRTRGK